MEAAAARMGDKIVAELGRRMKPQNKAKSLAQPSAESDVPGFTKVPSAKRTVVLVRLLTRISLSRHCCQTFIHDSIP
jgi:hypothetical protein